MKIPHFAAFGAVLAASLGTAALLGCTSVNPAEKQEAVKGIEDDKNPWLQKDGICQGVDTSKLPKRAVWLDSFEDGDPLFGGLNGWSAVADGKLDPTEDFQVSEHSEGEPEELKGKDAYSDSSKQALHMKAHFLHPDQLITDGDHWGINWQFEVGGGGGNVPAGTVRKAFDFTPYAGMVAWVRRGSPDASSSFTIQFPTPWTLEVASGGDGSCVYDKAAAGTDAGSGVNGKCYAHMTYSGTALDCWRPIKIYFEGPNFNLAPAFNPGPTAFDQGTVYGLEIAFSSSNAGNAAKYWPVDMWIDDMYFFKAEDDTN